MNTSNGKADPADQGSRADALAQRPGLFSLGRKTMILWFAGLPPTEVAARALIVGLVLSTMETAGQIGWGHEALLAANVPILAWAAARWWVDRRPPLL